MVRHYGRTVCYVIYILSTYAKPFVVLLCHRYPPLLVDVQTRGGNTDLHPIFLDKKRPD